MTDVMLQQPTVPDKVDGIICLDPPTLQCRDCGLTFTATSERTGRNYPLSVTVILSGCEGWGFCGCSRSTGSKLRRCGDCNSAHRATHPDSWRKSP